MCFLYPRASGLACVEAKCIGLLFYFQNLETRALKPHAEPIGINRDERVADMNQPHKEALQTVTAYESSTWPQDPPDFAQEFVLQFRGRHMMQHGE